MWALFVKLDGEWQFRGMTEHEEFAIEFEDSIESREDGTQYKIVYLED